MQAAQDGGAVAGVVDQATEGRERSGEVRGLRPRCACEVLADRWPGGPPAQTRAWAFAAVNVAAAAHRPALALAGLDTAWPANPRPDTVRRRDLFAGGTGLAVVCALTGANGYTVANALAKWARTPAGQPVAARLEAEFAALWAAL